MPHRLSIAGLLVVGIWLASAMVIARPANPPVDPTRTLDAALAPPDDVAALLRRACTDCHSDETRWPWYATLFPASWVIERDVREGRGHLNLSRFAAYDVFEQADLLDEVCIRAGARVMPPDRYRGLHPDARLADADVDRLCAWTKEAVTDLLGAYQ